MGKGKKVIGFKVDEELYKLLNKVAEIRGEYVSDFVRLAVKKELARMGYFPEEYKKALEVE